MAKTNLKLKADIYEDVATFNIDVSKDNFAMYSSQLNFNYLPRDRAGLIIHEMQYDTQELWNSVSGFNAMGDQVKWGLSVKEMTALTQFTLLNRFTVEYNSQELFIDAAPTHRMIRTHTVVRDYRSWRGGGLIMHPSSIWWGSYTFETSGPANDLTIPTRMYFSIVEMDDSLFKELWEQISLPPL